MSNFNFSINISETGMGSSVVMDSSMIDTLKEEGISHLDILAFFSLVRNKNRFMTQVKSESSDGYSELHYSVSKRQLNAMVHCYKLRHVAPPSIYCEN